MRGLGVLERITRASHRGFILAFHEISPDRFGEFMLCVSPLEAVSLTELVERLKARKSTRGLFAITVDDGIGWNVKELAAASVARALPITFYLPVDYLDKREGMPFQRWRILERLLPAGAVGPCATVADVGRAMRTMWHTRRPACYVPVLLELEGYVADRLGMAQSALQTAPPVSWPEVERLSKDPLIAFESHGMSHTAMSALNEAEIEFEMRRSREIISEHTSRRCRHFAYPFGSAESIGPNAAAVARRLYDSATTMLLGTVEGADPWLLPRIPLYAQNSRIKAAGKILLKCGRFSPFAGRQETTEGTRPSGEPCERVPMS